MIVLDTNVLSEAMRERPEPRVIEWLQRQSESEALTTAVTKAEILYGIATAPAGRKRTTLQAAADRVLNRTFAGRILAFEDKAASHYAQIAAARRARGRPIKPLDAQIAAIARLHNATLATRNTRDFEDCGIRLVDPWEG
jgi:predicted nucleic acid-binding protein